MTLDTRVSTRDAPGGTLRRADSRLQPGWRHVSCAGPNRAEANLEDCRGNVLPACGGCLWAQGVIQCP